MKYIDQIYQCQMPGQVFGTWQLQCHLRIFQPHPEVQTVIITDMSLDIGWFIPYTIEGLAEQIVGEFELNPDKLIWIEHYTPKFRKLSCNSFSEVTFEWENGRASNPQWTEIALETAQALTDELLTA